MKDGVACFRLQALLSTHACSFWVRPGLSEGLHNIRFFPGTCRPRLTGTPLAHLQGSGLAAAGRGTEGAGRGVGIEGALGWLWKAAFAACLTLQRVGG